MRCALLLALGLAVPLAGEEPTSAGMSGLIAAWRGDSAAERELASQRTVALWRSWTDADVELLRTASTDADPEVAQRASDALRAVEKRRRVRDRVDVVDGLVASLRTPEEKVQCHAFVNPGGPILGHSAPMKALEAMGSDIEPLLLDHVGDAEVRSEVAVVLASIGGVDSLRALITAIPAHDQRAEAYLVVYALWQLTGIEMGIDHKGFVPWDPDIRSRWEDWYEENGPYLYTAEDSRRGQASWGRDRVLVDLEAKNAGVPREEFRRAKPCVRFNEIAEWKETPEHAAMLRDFCVSLLLRELYDGGYPSREAVLSLGRIDDPRARTALEKLRQEAEPGSSLSHDVAWAAELAGEEEESTETRTPEPASEQRLANLRCYLKSESPRARVEAAETLWRLGSGEGVQVLIDTLDLRPLDGENLEATRRACEILGRVGDASAAAPLRRLLAENLNGVLATGGSGMGWSGRPDAVALARLGDEEGIRYLEKTIGAGDPFGVVGCWPVHSDIEDLGLRRFVPILVPLLNTGSKGNRIHAARAIVRLIDGGR